MKRSIGKSHCPINYSLEVIGDPWSLLIIRDIVCYNKHTFSEFLQSKEHISTRTLTMRLQDLQEAGILTVAAHQNDRRRNLYTLTTKGRKLIPILVELATWGALYDPETGSPKSWIDAVVKDQSLQDNTQRYRLPAFVGNT